MSGRLAQREVALALVAGRSGTGGDGTAPQPTGAWYSALAGVRAPGGLGTRTACGETMRDDTNGISHPVLPCGAKLFVSYGGKTVLTQVIDRGPYVPGRVIDLTESLAAQLGVKGVRPIRWAYASAP